MPSRFRWSASVPWPDDDLQRTISYLLQHTRNHLGCWLVVGPWISSCQRTRHRRRSNVLQHLTLFGQSASDSSSWAFLRLKTFSRRSRFMIRLTDNFLDFATTIASIMIVFLAAYELRNTWDISLCSDRLWLFVQLNTFCQFFVKDRWWNWQTIFRRYSEQIGLAFPFPCLRIKNIFLPM